MGVYVMDVRRARPLIAAVAAHGITDLDSAAWPPWYTLCCLLPLPGHAVTACFCAGSVFHFADDVGLGGSLALHACSAAVLALTGTQRALDLMLGYLACVHVPSHYWRCARRGRWRGLAIAGATTALALGAASRLDYVCVTHGVQRLVTAHVLTEWCRAQGVP